MAKNMMDIGLDANGDLAIVGGDFSMVESTYQHQRQLLMNNKGDFKQNPIICVGAATFIDDEGKAAIVREIAKEFLKDGMEVVNLNPNPAALTDSTLKIFDNSFYK